MREGGLITVGLFAVVNGDTNMQLQDDSLPPESLAPTFHSPPLSTCPYHCLCFFSYRRYVSVYSPKRDEWLQPDHRPFPSEVLSLTNNRRSNDTEVLFLLTSPL